MVDDATLREVALNKGEYGLVLKILGREPNYTELSMYGTMWSEHCSYKSSKSTIRGFPTKGSRVVQGPGENAGVVSLTDKLDVVFKIESHNHPSAIEPYQGAATGVGGIIRDIFTMGARPIASMDSLRFGPLSDKKNAFLFNGVVSGIGGYGNCIGIPTVGGEVYFDECYSGNPLVNAMCIGIIEKGKIVKGIASGVGNPVFLVGARTGRDGIHGVTFASVELSEKSQEDRPAVQVGDPFTEKLLVEACLEILKTGHVVGMQDLGGGGFTCAISETAAKANAGMEVDLSKVPRREEGMQPWEVLISESQERMLVILEKGHEKEIIDIFTKWDLTAVQVGTVIKEEILRISDNGKLVAELPPKSLAEPPLVERESSPIKRDEQNINVPLPSDLNEIMLALISSPNIASKEKVYRQYDHMVQTNTIVLPGSDSAVVRIRGTDVSLGISTDCNSRYCFLNPFEGGKIAVSESARNLACSGAEPIGLTNCLNFGNPEKPEVFWQFQQSVAGMSEAAIALGVPVISGNVSFYNECNGKAIYPTPVVGMVGIIKGAPVTQGFRDKGDAIVLLGKTKDDLSGSEYIKIVHGLVEGNPSISMDEEKSVQKACLEAIGSGLVKSAHDCSEGGIGVCLAESCISGGIGALVSLQDELRPDVSLFGESQSRIVVSVAPENIDALVEIAKKNSVPAQIIGKVGKNRLVVNEWVDLPVEELEGAWRSL